MNYIVLRNYNDGHEWVVADTRFYSIIATFVNKVDADFFAKAMNNKEES